MMFRKNRATRHPYATLAIFTIAGASMINLVNRAKRFFKEKTESVMSIMKKMTK